MKRISHSIANYHAFITIFLWVFFVAFTACSNRHENNNPAPIHKYFPPRFDLVQLKVTNDTLHFPLDEDSYRSIKSFNLIAEKGKEYICFFDPRSIAVNIYDLGTLQKIKTVPLKVALDDIKMYKPTVYVHTFDSIFVCNSKAIHLIDSAGVLKSKIPYLKEPKLAWAVFKNDAPAVYKNGSLFVSIRPYMNEQSLSALSEWQVLYEFDFKDKTAKFHYPLPAVFQQQLYGTDFLNHSYCYNDRGHFVFSFTGDSAIYETNLAEYHIAYTGKSLYQYAGIPPLSRQELNADDTKCFKTRDSYASIYFDPVKKRYLRVALSKITEQEYVAKKSKTQHVIIFDDQFRIIGESPIDSSVSLSSLFITSSGNIYARVQRKDEYAIHFVRLSYIEKNNQPSQIAKHEGS